MKGASVHANIRLPSYYKPENFDCPMRITGCVPNSWNVNESYFNWGSYTGSRFHDESSILTPLSPTGSPIKPTESPINPTENPTQTSLTGSPINPTESPISPTESPISPT